MSPQIILSTVLISLALVFYSLGVWLIWQVPYFGGMYMGMTRHLLLIIIASMIAETKIAGWFN